ncbi:MAG: septal ring lytic transglycosylase RlpA family protein [Roseomonas sp.]|jgi:rare lipoprotein A|uniref:Endolytic peptidoglycan transglycosylase RlpA n=1 Tax=Falsiroseomonas stagni DSM 19981 TaxID=1123062 RepID=A0A1I4F1L5_9PROT|nr:septal ring lytic transglycosylase RlpA family protein [Roseomonas sp.]SFL10707.1 rare lipoprotein A [Falsiroseomonas stagni DSM 19981]
MTTSILGFRLLPAALALACLVPLNAQAFEPQRGDAAVYSTRFQGRPMANGARFDTQAPTAAHLHLPLGTRAQVTNLRTGATTTVTITDRGPHTRGRIIDLSPRAAREIGFQTGVVPVEIRPVGNTRVAQR